MTRADIDAVALVNGIDRAANIPALLAYIDELECECGEAWEGVLDAALIHAELVRERDEARAQLAAIGTGAPCDGHRHCCADRRRLAEELLRVRAERDNAQLAFESCNRARRLAEEECDALRSSLERKIRHCDEILEERDEALKEKL